WIWRGGVPSGCGASPPRFFNKKLPTRCPLRQTVCTPSASTHQRPRCPIEKLARDYGPLQQGRSSRYLTIPRQYKPLQCCCKSFLLSCTERQEAAAGKFIAGPLRFTAHGRP